MKSILIAIAAAVSVFQLAHAEDVTVKITKIHMCCGSCEKGATNAVKDVAGCKIVASKEDKDVVLTAPDTATIQKACDALTKAGFYGECSDSSIKMDATTGAKGENVKSLKLEDVHMCCPKCVKAFNIAMKEVSGVTTNNCVKNAKVIVVSGDFKDSDVTDALQKAGFTGKVVE